MGASAAPVAMGVLGAVAAPFTGGASLALAGAGISAYGAVENGKASQEAANYQAQVAANNAQIANYNAQSAIQTGNTQLQAAQEQGAQQQGMIRAVYGAGGIDTNSGSALREQVGVAQVNQLNQATITSNAQRAAWNFQNQGANFAATSQLETMERQQAQTAGLMGGFSSLLSGAGTFSNQYNKLYPQSQST
jgi:hypothetical protein